MTKNQGVYGSISSFDAHLSWFGISRQDCIKPTARVDEGKTSVLVFISLPTTANMAPLGHLSAKPKAWHALETRGLSLLSSHQQYWYHTVGLVLATLLDNAGYSYRAQVSILYRFAGLVTPTLGRAPDPGFPRWKSFMTDDHTPVELSWDFHTGAERPTIRYSIEPIALDAGTAANPNNDRAGADFKQDLLHAFPETDMTWFNHFEECFVHDWGDDTPEGHRSTVFWAFDLKEKGGTTKAYFFPGTVARATKRTNLEAVSDAIVDAPGYRAGGVPSFDLFTSYVNRSPDIRFEVDMLALDLVHVDKSRLKIYFRDRRTDFASVRDSMSLGGQLQGPDFEEGMKRLKVLWDSLLGTEGLPEDVPLPHKGHRTAGILYNIEFRMNSKNPLVKIYIPARHYAEDDQQIIDTLCWYMTEEVGRRRGLPTAAVSARLYSKCMHQAL